MEMLGRVESGPDGAPATPTKTLSRSPSTATADNSTRPATQSDKTHVLEFRVSDNGPGIPDHLQKKVFEPFVQAEMRLSKVHEGVGLGLSICRQIVKMLGGSIRLDSELGQGSTFTIQVPVGVKDQQQQEREQREKEQREHAESLSAEIAKPPPVYGKDNKPRLDRMPSRPKVECEGDLKILVAEDNPTNRTVILQMLKLQKFCGEPPLTPPPSPFSLYLTHLADVTLAKDGREALLKIQEAMENDQAFGVVLMDIQMPGLDGIECTRTVRRLGYNAPIVALTAFADEGNKNECLDAGMNYFLPKPIDKKSLRQVLRTCMGYDGGTPLSTAGLPTPPPSKIPTPELNETSSVV